MKQVKNDLNKNFSLLKILKNSNFELFFPVDSEYNLPTLVGFLNTVLGDN